LALSVEIGFFGGSAVKARVSLNRQRKSFIARVASKNTASSDAASHRPKVGNCFAFNPATGALEIALPYRDKAENALIREVRHVQFRLKLRLLRLYLHKLALDPRSARLLVQRYFPCNFNYLLWIVQHFFVFAVRTSFGPAHHGGVASHYHRFWPIAQWGRSWL
jgi:hypothetical protein